MGANWWGLTDGWRLPKVTLEFELKFEFGLEAEREEVRSKERSI